jgi:hypothetical protein
MMKTPFDSALRVQARTLNAIRLSLLAEIAREHLVEAEQAALAVSIRREASVAAVDWQLCAHPYGQHQRTQRQRLDNDRRGIHASLETLRGAAMDACGQMQAITEAATGFANDLRRREAGAEQAQSDDFSGARFNARQKQSAFSAQ